MATLTITTSSPEDARIAAAFGAYLGKAGNASAAEVKTAVVAYIKQIVRQQEFAVAQASIVVTDIAPT